MEAKVKITNGDSEAWVLPESVYVWEEKGWKLDKQSVKDAGESGALDQDEIERQLGSHEAENVDQDNTASGRPEASGTRAKRGSTSK
jgi:hypothetical protein